MLPRDYLSAQTVRYRDISHDPMSRLVFDNIVSERFWVGGVCIVNRRLLIVGSVLILITAAVYQNNFLIFKVVDFVDSTTKGAFSLRESRNVVMNVIDDVNPLKESCGILNTTCQWSI